MKLKEYITKFYPLIDLTNVLIFISQGKVKVNNQVIKNPNFIISEEDAIEILLPKNYVKNTKLKNNRIKGFEKKEDDKFELGSFFAKPSSELLQKNFVLKDQDKKESDASYYTIKIPKLKIFDKKLRQEKKLEKEKIKKEKEFKKQTYELEQKYIAQVKHNLDFIKEKKFLLEDAKEKIDALSIPPSITNLLSNKEIEKIKIDYMKKMDKEAKKKLKNGQNENTFDFTSPAFDHIISSKNKKRKIHNKAIPKSRVIYEDDDFICVNKLLYETVTGEHNKIEKRVILYLKKEGVKEINLHYHNTLDEETKGIIIFTKNERARKEFHKIVKARKLKSIYYAVCIPAPFFKEKKHFSLPLPFRMNSNNRLEQVSKDKKHLLRRIQVDYIGNIVIKKKKYPILKITTTKLRNSSIRFVLTFYGMTIINDKKMAKHRYSDNLLLFHSELRISKRINSRFAGLVFKLERDKVFIKMKDILEKTMNKANNGN